MTSQWARWCLKSPTSRLYAQPFVQARIKENIKAPRHWPLWSESTGDRWIPHTKGQSRRKCFHLMMSSWQSLSNWVIHWVTPNIDKIMAFTYWDYNNHFGYISNHFLAVMPLSSYRGMTHFYDIFSPRKRFMPRHNMVNVKSTKFPQ